MVRGEVFRLAGRARARGHEQSGPRYAVVLQSDDLLGLSTALVAPTSTRAQPATFRPVIGLLGTETRVMADQVTAVDVQRLGKSAGRLGEEEMTAVDEAVRLVFGL
jgi:mRNA interferase MazF